MEGWLIFGVIMIFLIIVADTVLAYGNYRRSTANKKEITKLKSKFNE